MSSALVVGEDALCCALGEQLVRAAFPQWRLAGPSIDKGGITKLIPALRRYSEIARHLYPVLCIADTDGRCVRDLLTSWLPQPVPERFLLRLAVTEAESWLLADREGFADSFRVPLNKVPQTPDEIDDPKRMVLNLLSNSRQRRVREESVSQTDPNRPGPGYNLHLCSFLRDRWSAQDAQDASPSLRRAFHRLQNSWA